MNGSDTKSNLSRGPSSPRMQQHSSLSPPSLPSRPPPRVRPLSGVFRTQAPLRTLLNLDSDNAVVRQSYARTPIFPRNNNPHTFQSQRNRRLYETHHRANLFLEAFLLLLCRQQYSDDIEKQQNLFEFLRHHLQQLNILQVRVPPPTSAIAMLRDQCCLTVSRLITNFPIFAEMPLRPDENGSLVSARDSYWEGMIVNCPELRMLRAWSEYSIFCAPRYRSEFEQIEQLGKGGYGRVYRVQSKMDKCEYAIKKIHLSSTDQKSFANVRREVELFARLKHPNIVDYVTSWLESSLNSDDFDVSRSNTCSSCTSEDSGSIFGNGSSHRDEQSDGENRCAVHHSGATLSEHFTKLVVINKNDKDIRETSSILKETRDMLHPNGSRNKSKGFVATLYIQMELCSRTLTGWIEERNKNVLESRDRSDVINEVDSDSIFRQILLGVQYIHSEHLMHRDLNPNNIFVNENLCVKIGDFGLARQESLDSGPPTPLATIPNELTSDVGTTMYSAPEQLDGSNYDQKADLYSLGLIEFELFYPIGTRMERNNLFKALRDFDGYVEETNKMKQKFPNQVDLIRTLLNRKPSERSSASQLVSQIFSKIGDDKDPISDLKVLKEELKSKCNCIKKQSSQIKRLKWELRMSQRQVVRLKRKINSMASKEPTSIQL